MGDLSTAIAACVLSKCPAPVMSWRVLDRWLAPEQTGMNGPERTGPNEPPRNPEGEVPRKVAGTWFSAQKCLAPGFPYQRGSRRHVDFCRVAVPGAVIAGHSFPAGAVRVESLSKMSPGGHCGVVFCCECGVFSGKDCYERTGC